MELSTIGSIRQYARGAALKTQWDLKKKSGDVTAHSKGLNDFLSVGGFAAKTPEEADNEKLQAITNKVNVGMKLTDKEMDYLREKNPQLYEKLRQIEKEQKDYEDALRRCKTKDEAQRLHLARMGEAMQAAKNGDGTAAYRMNRMSESMTAFSETGEYKSLGSEAEQALRRTREAERAERSEPDTEPRDAEKPKESVPAPRAARADAPERAAADAPAARSENAAPERGRGGEGVRSGEKAYRSERESESREERRRRTVDAEA